MSENSHDESEVESEVEENRQQQSSGEVTGSELAGLAQHVFGGISTSAYAALGATSDDEINNSNSSFNSRPPLPPPPPQRQNSAEQEYHRKNQEFLQQATVIGLKKANSASTTSTYGAATPSPNTQFRKRLHLKAIEEYDDGQQSFVVLPGSRSRNNTGYSSSPANHIIVNNHHHGTHHQHPPATLAAGAGDDWTTTSIKFDREGNDDQSVMSSLAGSIHYGSYNNNGSRRPGQSARDAEAERLRLANFEWEQEERFQQRKRDMEKKLSNVLRQNGTSKEETETNELVQSYLKELEKERAALLAQWKSEMIIEEERFRQEMSRRRLGRDCYVALIKPWMDPIISILMNTEVVLSNMPLTIGAVGLSWVTMGVVWFKFTEEMLDSCQHVHYFSTQCKFREFPGCFACDLTNPWYQMALHFHWFCSTVAGIACVLFILKVILAPHTVIHMLRNPTTSTPVGVWCIAMVCTFAGQHGTLGEIIVIVVSCLHVMLAFWFLYMAIFKFHLWADPGWFPNVVGISYAAVKTWIYFPDTGLCLMALCTFFFLGTFFFSVVRVALNHKIAAPVCWIQLSAPSITLYALTLISQPTPTEEILFSTSNEDKQQYENFLKTYYLPSQHFFMGLTMIGLVSAIHSLWIRWPTFKTKPFSPAHVAFCFPTLSHTNAIQAYRASLNAYASIPPDHISRKILFGYWCLFLVSGTILNIVFTIKYVLKIPEWTTPDLTGEEEPPAHSKTVLDEIMIETGAHEIIRQPFVSPAVLEANETGVLVRVRRGTEDYRVHGPFVRTRNVSSIGFDPILSQLELREERARLLDWVAKNNPRARNRTMSVPGVMHLRRGDGRDVYGTFSDLSQAETLLHGHHTRSKTTIGTTSSHV